MPPTGHFSSGWLLWTDETTSMVARAGRETLRSRPAFIRRGSLANQASLVVRGGRCSGALRDLATGESSGVRRTLTRSGRGTSPVVLRPDPGWWARLRSPPMAADGPPLKVDRFGGALPAALGHIRVSLRTPGRGPSDPNRRDQQRADFWRGYAHHAAPAAGGWEVLSLAAHMAGRNLKPRNLMAAHPAVRPWHDPRHATATA